MTGRTLLDINCKNIILYLSPKGNKSNNKQMRKLLSNKESIDKMQDDLLKGKKMKMIYD